MTNVTIKGLPPATAVKAFSGARARPYLERHEPCPYTPQLTGTTDANGNVTLDLPDEIEHIVQLPDGTGRWVLNSTTKGGTP
jgi:hypothetical protein